MTSISAGHIILTPTQPVGSGRPQRGSNPGPPDQESRALPTELPRPPEREAERRKERGEREGERKREREREGEKERDSAIESEEDRDPLTDHLKQTLVSN